MRKSKFPYIVKILPSLLTLVAGIFLGAVFSNILFLKSQEEVFLYLTKMNYTTHSYCDQTYFTVSMRLKDTDGNRIADVPIYFFLQNEKFSNLFLDVERTDKQGEINDYTFFIPTSCGENKLIIEFRGNEKYQRREEEIEFFIRYPSHISMAKIFPLLRFDPLYYRKGLLDENYDVWEVELPAKIMNNITPILIFQLKDIDGNPVKDRLVECIWLPLEDTEKSYKQIVYTDENGTIECSFQPYEFGIFRFYINFGGDHIYLPSRSDFFNIKYYMPCRLDNGTEVVFGVHKIQFPCKDRSFAYSLCNWESGKWSLFYYDKKLTEFC